MCALAWTEVSPRVCDQSFARSWAQNRLGKARLRRCCQTDWPHGGGFLMSHTIGSDAEIHSSQLCPSCRSRLRPRPIGIFTQWNGGVDCHLETPFRYVKVSSRGGFRSIVSSRSVIHPPNCPTCSTFHRFHHIEEFSHVLPECNTGLDSNVQAGPRISHRSTD